jgi:phosphopantetheinyl transferase (holo-ACP synthase)
MDRSISSLSGSGNTGDSSLSTSRILADLESKTSALGHVGLLKWQRNELNKKYLQQRELTEVEKQNAAASRKLALRLAAQIAVKEAKLKSHSEALATAHGSNYVAARKQDAVVKDLESKLQDDLARANALLRTLGGPESLSSMS